MPQKSISQYPSLRSSTKINSLYGKKNKCHFMFHRHRFLVCFSLFNGISTFVGFKCQSHPCIKIEVLLSNLYAMGIRRFILSLKVLILKRLFFVWAFKIVGDSWKFSMLLLYILWDDWSIFKISRSKEQLQKQLEYTLLNPDSHSWWSSKIQSVTWEERYAIKSCFKLEKNATETYGMLQTAFRPSCMNRASVFEWHKRFKEGRESVRDDERCGRSMEVNTPELIGQSVRLRGRVTMLRF